MRLSNARLRRRQTTLIYPDHRLPLWLTGDATPAFARTDCQTMALVQGYCSALSSPPSSPVARNVNSASVNLACDISQRARRANSCGTRTSLRRASPKRDESVITIAGTPSPRIIVASTCAEATSGRVATTSQVKSEVDVMVSSNDEVERRGAVSMSSEADLSRTSTHSLGSPKMPPPSSLEPIVSGSACRSPHACRSKTTAHRLQRLCRAPDTVLQLALTIANRSS